MKEFRESPRLLVDLIYPSQHLKLNSKGDKSALITILNHESLTITKGVLSKYIFCFLIT